MKMNVLAIAVALPDRDLLARLPVLAGNERTATAELVAHLAALRLRPSLYAAQGYGSLFAYCRQALRLSEDAASNRIHAARACLKFPLILELLASGELSLSAVRILRPHLTTENHERILGRARNARKADTSRGWSPSWCPDRTCRPRYGGWLYRGRQDHRPPSLRNHRRRSFRQGPSGPRQI